jgi:hypothetical protein
MLFRLVGISVHELFHEEAVALATEAYIANNFATITLFI